MVERPLSPASIVLLGALAVSTLAPLSRVAPATNDDIRFANSMRRGVVQAYRDLDDHGRDQGRPHGLKIVTWAIPFLVDRISYYRAAMIGLTLSAALLLALVIREVTGSHRVAALGLLLYLVGLENDLENSFLSTAAHELVTLNLLLASLALFPSRSCGRRDLPRLGASALIYALTLTQYELYFLYYPIFLVLALRRGGDPRAAARLYLPHLVATLVGLLLYAHAHAIARAGYAGTTVYLENGLAPALAVVGQFARWTLPGATAFNERYHFVFDTLLADQALGILPAVKSLCAVAALVLLARGLAPAPRRGRDAALALAVCGYGFLAPLILVALTRQYQIAVREGQLFGYRVCGHSLLFLVSFVSLAAWRGLSSARQPVRALTLLALLPLVAGGAFLTARANALVSRAQESGYARHWAVDRLLATEEYRALPPHSLLVAPSLFEAQLATSYDGPPGFSNARGVPDARLSNYWTEYFRLRGHVAVDVSPAVEHARAALAGDPVYGLQRLQPGYAGPACALAMVRIPGGPEEGPSDLLIVRAEPGRSYVFPVVHGAGRPETLLQVTPAPGQTTVRVQVASGAVDVFRGRIADGS